MKKFVQHLLPLSVLLLFTTALCLIVFNTSPVAADEAVAALPATIAETVAAVPAAVNTVVEDVDAGQKVSFFSFYGFLWLIALAGSIAALVYARKFYLEMMQADEGNEEMINIAGAVREGADAYLWQQYKVVGIFFAVICILLAMMGYYGMQSKIVWFAFLTGGFFSGLAGWCGMKTATWASSRTAAAAQKSLNQGLQVAFRSGAVMGLTVVGLGLLDITLWFGVLYWIFPSFFNWDMSLLEITVTMLCFGMGASSQALFARVGGGIYTKAADVGADLVGKVEAGIPEDDKRNPATIADNVGDNVGDVAGMGADLYESYCGSILATAALGVAAFTGSTLPLPEGYTATQMQLCALFLPMILAAIGTALSIWGVFFVKTEEKADQGTLLKALARGIDTSSILIAVIAIPITVFMLTSMYWGVGVSVMIGLGAGWLIGKWTEYSTSYEHKPTRDVAEQSLTGPATVIIAGIAEGMWSVWCPVVVVCVATLLSFAFAAQGNFNDVTWFAMGLYGIGISAVGMLSTLGLTLATDAYGPIADNAGGNAEMAGLDPIVRERTDALDSLGNTTAATGKGFAIGSAALTALALLAAYVEEVRVGFERWGTSAVTQMIGKEGESFKPGYYKLNDQFVVGVEPAVAVNGENGKLAHYTTIVQGKNDEGQWERVTSKIEKHSEKLVKVGAKGSEKYYACSTFLVMPEQLRHKGAKGWTERKAGFIESDEFVATLLPEAVGGLDKPRASFGKEELTSVEWASMMDWMTYYSCNLMNPKVLVGMFLGAMATFIFCALTMKAVGRAARGMVEEVRRQFKQFPGIMDYSQKPDYKEPVRISTQAAQREMIFPSVLGLALPVVGGLILGVAGVIGMLVGTLTCGFCLAVFMANAGGSWDNAKKYIEAGHLGGKRSEPHKAAVVGDTVGDPFKDTSGPSLNILIKLMSMVSVVVAGFIVRCSLVALGWF